VLRKAGVSDHKAAPPTRHLGPARRGTEDRLDRLLRPSAAVVVRVRDGLNINVYLVRVGVAAPYFYDYRRGRYARELIRLALRARRLKLGLWGRCPRHTLGPEPRRLDRVAVARPTTITTVGGERARSMAGLTVSRNDSDEPHRQGSEGFVVLAEIRSAF
jgi:Staphylococcal nuclease homologue